MPNPNDYIDSALVNIDSAMRYRQRILDAVPNDHNFLPLMTAYLTDDMSPDVLERGKEEGVFIAAKLYPANATTNSADGVSDLNCIDPLLETMQRIGLPLLIHGEVVDPDIDIFDREAIFIERYLGDLLIRYPSLKIVLEHITTKDAVEFVQDNNSNLAATITPHHLHINRNAMFDNGFRSDFYCLPVAKREKHRLALRKAATSGKPCFFLGTDSAPHTRVFKESSCCCAGIFNAPFALQSYAQVFDEEGAMDKLENFASVYGPYFYELPLNTRFITLIKKEKYIPTSIEFKSDNQSIEKVVPFHGGESLQWSLLDN